MTQDALLQRVKKVRVSDTVVDQILALIENGRLQAGMQLPGERELVEQLQVGRASVREALRILEAQGNIEVRPGIGAFITGDATNLSGQEAIKVWFRDNASEVLKMLDIREALERRAASLAAKLGDEKCLADLKAVLDEAETFIARNDLEQLSYADQRFHRLLTRASGNELLAQLNDGAIEATISPRHSIQRLPGRARTSLNEHHVVLRALMGRDPVAAEQAILQHLSSARAAILTLRDDKPPEKT